MSAESPSLYELGFALEEAFAAVEAQLADNDGEYTPEMASVIDAAEGAFDTKVERVALYIRSLSSQVLGIAVEETRLKKRREALVKRADWLKDFYLRQALERHGKKEVRGTLATVRIQLSPPSVRCSLPAEFLPVEWVRIKPAEHSLDKEMVLTAYRKGEALPEGVSVERTQSVRVV